MFVDWFLNNSNLVRILNYSGEASSSAQKNQNDFYGTSCVNFMIQYKNLYKLFMNT